MKDNNQHLVDGIYPLKSLLNIDQLRTMFEKFSRATGVNAVLVSLPDNETLMRTGWQDICTRFHRAFPESSKKCEQCDRRLFKEASAHQKSVSQRCPNGLIDGITPIVVRGTHVANLFAGQVLLEKPDTDYFRKQAETYGYDVDAYLQALEAVPVVSETAFREAMSFFGDTTVILAEQGLKELRNKEAREALAAQKQRLDYILWGTSVGTWEWNVQTGETVFNERWADIIGYALADISPVSVDTWMQYCHPEDLKRSNALLRKCFTGQADHYECEVRMRHKNGDWVWVLDRGKVASWTGDGQPLWMYGTHQEITARKQAEKHLRDSEETYRNLFHNAQVGLFRTRIEDGKILEANEQIARMFGYDNRKDFITEYATSGNYVDPGTRECMLKAIQQYGEVRNFEARFYRKDRTIFWSSYSARIFPEKGWIEGVVEDITERKQAEQALATNEKRLRSITDNARDFIFIKNADRRYTFVNPAMERLLNLPKEAILEKTPEEIFGDEAGALISEIDDRTFVGETINETRMLVIDEAERYFNTVQTPFDVDANGRVRSIMGIVREVTDLKRTERDLRESNEKFQVLTDQSLMGIHIIYHGRVDYINEASLCILGYERSVVEDWAANEFAKVIHPDDLGRVMEQARRKQAGERDVTTRYQWRVVTKTGEIKWVESYSKTIPYKNDLADLVTMVEITERKRAEEALREREENLRTTLNSIGDAVIATDLGGTVKRMNPVAESLTGWSVEAAMGRPVAEVFNIMDSETREAINPPLEQALDGGNIARLSHHTILVARDGTEYQIADSAAPIRDDEGNVKGVVLVFRDVTEKYRNEKELQRMQKLESLGTVAGGIAHDFNNLIMGVFGNIEMAKIGLAEDHESYSFLSDAHGALENARRLTGQLLTFARGGDPVMEIVDIRSLVKETATFHLSGSKIRPSYHLSGDLWPIKADKGQIGQVFANLVINAKQAMPGGGFLHIEGENTVSGTVEDGEALPGRCVRIAVRDEGTGIPPKILERIFDPYFSTKKSGNGLGLAIAHSIVVKHRGLIRVSSTPDVGTTFTLFFPAGLSEEDLASAGIVRKTDEPANGPLHILLMDDEKIILKTTPSMLKKRGHSVETAKDGEEALEKYAAAAAKGAPFDLVIMDLTIPGGMGGKEAIGKLREMAPSAKVIVSSGYSSDPVMASYKEYGFSGRLAKPFNLRELADEIARVMESE